MFSEQDRQIFGPYFSGVAEVYGDPLCLYRRLVHALDGEPNKVLRGMKADDEPTRFDCTERAVAAARDVFGLLPFDPQSGGGVLDRDALAVLRQFTDWLDEKKNHGPTEPTSPPSTPAAESCPTP